MAGTINSATSPSALSSKIIPIDRILGWLERYGGEVEAVFHLGANASTTETDADHVIDTNLNSSTAWWRWYAAQGKKLIYASSAATYGDGTEGFDDADDYAALKRLQPLNLTAGQSMPSIFGRCARRRKDTPHHVAKTPADSTISLQDAANAQAEIAKLGFQLARYQRVEFGRSSEKPEREADQLELAIETLEADQAERLGAISPVIAAAIEAAVESKKPARRALPDHLPREEKVHAAPCTCPSCGGALRRIGEDITETLDYVPGRFKVIRHIREKLSCRICDTVVAAPTPDHAIARGRAGAGLLAHIVVSKYDDHLPLL